MFQLTWNKKAAIERRNILKFWINHNGSDAYSKNINAEIKKIQKLLARNPEMGTLSALEGIRYVVILRKFLLYYQFKNKEIQVLSLWDNSRNPEDLEINE